MFSQICIILKSFNSLLDIFPTCAAIHMRRPFSQILNLLRTMRYSIHSREEEMLQFFNGKYMDVV